MNVKNILNNHKKWLENSSEGKRADLSNADLSSADLYGANLSYAGLRNANLSGANLSGANLYGSNLSGANLSGANLSGADLRNADFSNTDLSNAGLRNADFSNTDLSNAGLRNANLSGANLSNAGLRNADLRNADFSNTDLYGANLSYADLNGIKLNNGTRFYFPLCPNGCFTAYKKAQEKIVVLEIPADAKRSSATTYKCRANKAKVLRIENLDGSLAEEKFVASNYDESFVYTVGETVKVKDFDENRWNECSRGIHFFISRDMAVKY